MNTDSNPKTEFCRLLDVLHEAHERGDIKAVESISAQLFAIAASEQAKNPSEKLRLKQEATEHANAARWDQAEAAYRRVLSLAEKEGHQGIISRSHSDLSNLHQFRGMRDGALQEAKAAVDAARKSDVPVLLSFALLDLARCQLMNGDIGSAATAAEEAVQTVPADKMSATSRARALVMRARCRVEQRRVSDAQRDLDDAWQLLAPLAKSMIFAGVQVGLANWWEVTARIRTETDDLAGAAEALGKAVEFMRIVSQMPQHDGPYKFFWLANTLQKYSAALTAAGDFDAAVGAFDECRAICVKIGVDVPGARIA